MADIADKLDGLVNDLAGLENGLELGGLILVHQVLIQVEAGRCQKRTGIIVQVSREALPFFFLQFDRGVQQYLLLLLFHLLYFFMEAEDPALVHDEEYNKATYQHDHAHGAKEQHSGNSRFGGLQEEHNRLVSGYLVYIISKLGKEDEF